VRELDLGELLLLLLRVEVHRPGTSPLAACACRSFVRVDMPVAAS
jgi:hypothetical protein